uniref:Uncharacterized protein n=1 Tax=Chromera velia CCMP2878 TaxID=1169474 RepID=A0A0G4F2W6_9ALVE|eukprot:Cvel_14808.t1-p1 / transcript=Cvel_14808.t1 / gene=Cvel_14808 / organism=Chromera_velia_CCMP2878 / gene_product=hypothetical protein / transcript_product=hypothetical protein / location=Cvel_scaffold1068:37271-38991(-) / protein_length=312 / sequence_SO=supercontig / SO=protein_coding / is_pseudo=false
MGLMMTGGAQERENLKWEQWKKVTFRRPSGDAAVNGEDSFCKAYMSISKSASSPSPPGVCSDPLMKECSFVRVTLSTDAGGVDITQILFILESVFSLKLGGWAWEGAEVITESEAVTVCAGQKVYRADSREWGMTGDKAWGASVSAPSVIERHINGGSKAMASIPLPSVSGICGALYCITHLEKLRLLCIHAYGSIQYGWKHQFCSPSLGVLLGSLGPIDQWKNQPSPPPDDENRKESSTGANQTGGWFRWFRSGNGGVDPASLSDQFPFHPSSSASDPSCDKLRMKACFEQLSRQVSADTLKADEREALAL